PLRFTLPMMASAPGPPPPGLTAPDTLPMMAPPPARVPPVTCTLAWSVAPAATVVVPDACAKGWVIAKMPARTWKLAAARLWPVSLSEAGAVCGRGVRAGPAAPGMGWVVVPATGQLVGTARSAWAASVQGRAGGTARYSRGARRRRAKRAERKDGRAD